MSARDWDERYGAEGLLWRVEPNRFVVAEVEGMTPGTALDLACGEGRNAVWLAQQGWRVVAVDFSRAGLDKARRLAESGEVAVEWVEADVMGYRPVEPFGLVLVAYLHVEPQQRPVWLARSAAATAPGGTLLVIAHHRDNYEHGYGGPPDPALSFTQEEVIADLAGFEIERAERVERPVETDDGARIAYDVVVRARRS